MVVWRRRLSGSTGLAAAVVVVLVRVLVVPVHVRLGFGSNQSCFSSSPNLGICFGLSRVSIGFEKGSGQIWFGFGQQWSTSHLVQTRFRIGWVSRFELQLTRFTRISFHSTRFSFSSGQKSVDSVGQTWSMRVNSVNWSNPVNYQVNGSIKTRNTLDCMLASQVVETTLWNHIKLALHKDIKIMITSMAWLE